MGNTVSASQPERVAKARRFVGLGLVIGLVALILDQAVKILVERNMQLHESIEVIPGFLDIHYILNPGAAFSIGEQFTIIFAILQAVVVVYVVYLLLRKVYVRSWAIVLGCLLGGVAGNLTDRIFREPAFGFGHVVDMFSVQNFAVFNVADSFIVCSMIVVAYMLVRGKNLDGTIGDKQATPTPGNDEGTTDPQA